MAFHITCNFTKDMSAQGSIGAGCGSLYMCNVKMRRRGSRGGDVAQHRNSTKERELMGSIGHGSLQPSVPLPSFAICRIPHCSELTKASPGLAVRYRLEDSRLPARLGSPARRGGKMSCWLVRREEGYCRADLTYMYRTLPWRASAARQSNRSIFASIQFGRITCCRIAGCREHLPVRPSVLITWEGSFHCGVRCVRDLIGGYRR